MERAIIGNLGEINMDAGPFRAPQPVERRVPSRQEPTSRQAEELEPVKEEPRSSRRTEIPQFDEPKKHKKLFKRVILPIIIVLVVAGLGLFGWAAWNKAQSGAVAIDTSKYQAVFFTNGQVYFGKLKPVNGQYMELTDIFYLQTQASGSGSNSSNPQSTSSDQNSVQLIKLGNEVHGPEDQMVISKDQVLFYENLKPDGKVAQSIDKYKNP